MEKVVLIDGNNLIFRSYYATAYRGELLTNSKGLPTNAIYAYVQMLIKIIAEEKPTHIMVAFDKGKTFRHESYDDYKGGRNETPSELKQQIPYAKQITRAMGITVEELENYEADDIIGTYSKKIETEVLLVSSDRDLLQLISPNVKMKLLKMKDFIYYDEKSFYEDYGIKPIEVIDLKALMGDSSDNIKGVTGIGEKTALKLIKEYHTIDNLYKNINNLKGKIKENLLNDKASAYKSLELATIYLNVPIEVNLEKIVYKGSNEEELNSLLKELEFTSLFNKMKMKKNEEKLEIEIIEDTNFSLNEDYSLYLLSSNLSYFKSKTLGVAISTKDKNYFIKTEYFNDKIFNNNFNKYTYDVKRVDVALSLLNFNNNINFDNYIAYYLLNEKITEDIAFIMNNKGYDIKLNEDIFKKDKILIEEENLINDACKKARFIYEEKNRLIEEIDKNDLHYLYYDIELKLALILANMEKEGILVDKSYLDNLEIEIRAKLKDLEEKIYAISEEEFNISSPKQLGVILFEKLNIPYPKKSKNSNYSTDKEVLDKIRIFNPIVSLVEEYRMLSKLNSNYVVGLKEQIMSDNKIHTIYNQCLTRTGRLSSKDPNLQNIPNHDEYGRLIRKCFISQEGYTFLSSDYSQIELRLFAEFSNVDSLKEAFINNEDIHRFTAAKIFNKDIKDVTKEERSKAKAVNFGIIYGISSFGLANDLSINVNDAKDFIDKYMEKFHGIKEYMKKEVEDAKKLGYVKTIMNRKRLIDEIKSSNYMIRMQGERMALNTPIQGSGSDILKKAMIDIDTEFKNKNIKSKMLLQIHDELVFEVKEEEIKIVKEIVKEKMENAFKLSVPLIVDINLGKDLYEAK
ncbi:MAG: DNA polymerase I [Clostridiales bacterium]|nr:DNA polymerase I [Clostridiales bacterium]